MGWELFVGLRYLRSRRNERFVSVITAISTVSVLLGVMVLTIVLSVMTGFEEDLRRRILGLNPHVRVVDRITGGTIADPERFVEIVESNPEVLAAAKQVLNFGESHSMQESMRNEESTSAELRKLRG